MVNLDSSKLVTINQIHSSEILIADSPGFYDPADGIINKGGNLVCSIKVADCLPVFFANNISKTIGLVHAGWRGISSGIIGKFVESIKLCDENNFKSIFPPINLCGDNAAMIAMVGLEKFKMKQFDNLDYPAKPRWPLDENAAFLKGAGVKL